MSADAVSGKPLRRRFAVAMPSWPGATPRFDHVEVDVDGAFFVPEVVERYGLSGYEPETSAVLLALCSRMPGDRWFFDVGANVGTFSWVIGASLPAVRIAGFEPTPALAADFRAIAERISTDIVVDELALGSADGTTELWLSDRSDASNSLNQQFRNVGQSVSVEVRRLDQYVAATRRVPFVIKIDTESTEPDVIEGAMETLREHRPWIVCEVLPGGATSTRIHDLLGPINYSFHKLDGLIPAPAHPTLAVNPRSKHRNWLFAPDPIDDALWSGVDAYQRALERCRPAIGAAADVPDGDLLARVVFDLGVVTGQGWHLWDDPACFVDLAPGGGLRVDSRLGQDGHRHVSHGSTPLDQPSSAGSVVDRIPAGRCRVVLDRQTLAPGSRAQLVVMRFSGDRRVGVDQFPLRDGRNVADVTVGPGEDGMRFAFRIAGDGCQVLGPLAVYHVARESM